MIKPNVSQDISKDLAKEALIASENLFLGKSTNGVNGPSLKTYLDYVYSADVNKENLSPIISSNFQKAKEAIDLLDSNLVNQINNDKTTHQIEIQKSKTPTNNTYYCSSGPKSWRATLKQNK